MTIHSRHDHGIKNIDSREVLLHRLKPLTEPNIHDYFYHPTCKMPLEWIVLAEDLHTFFSIDYERYSVDLYV